MIENRARHIWTATLAALVVALLAACSQPYEDRTAAGGITAGQTVERLEATPGVEDASFSTAPWWSRGEAGFGATGGMDLVLQVRFDRGRHLTDPGAALVSLVQLAWATNLHYPVGNVVVLLDGGVSMNFSWVPLATAVFGQAEEVSTKSPGPSPYSNGSPFSTYGRSGIAIPVTAVASRLGGWPGAAPQQLRLALADGAPTPIRPEALDFADMRPATGEQEHEHRCWELDVSRDWDGFGEFDGPVHLELAVDGVPAGDAWLMNDPWNRPTVCTPAEPAATSRITATFTPNGDASRFGLRPVALVGTIDGLRLVPPWDRPPRRDPAASGPGSDGPGTTP